MKKTLIIGIVVLIGIGGALYFQLGKPEAKKLENKINTSNQVPHMLQKESDRELERKKRLAQMKAQAEAFKKAQKQKAMDKAEKREPAYRPGQMEKTNAAGASLDELLAKGPKDTKTAQLLNESTEVILSKRYQGAVRLKESTCIKQLCRVTMATHRPQLLRAFLEGIEAESWPWKGRHKLLINKASEPVKPGEKIVPGQPVEIQMSLYFSSNDKRLPVDADLQFDGTEPRS